MGTPQGYVLCLRPQGSPQQSPWTQIEGARTTREIAENIRIAQGRVRAGSVGHMPRDLTLPLAGDQEERRPQLRGVGESLPGGVR